MGRLKKTRFHSRWKIDHDYVDRLNEHARAWLEKFDDEFYRAEFSSHPLHRPEHIREIYDAQNAAARDLVTANPDVIAARLRKNRGKLRPSHAGRYYQMEDYAMFRDAPPAAADVETEVNQETEAITDTKDQLKRSA